MPIEFTVAIDGLSMLMLGLIVGVGVPVALHAAASLPASQRVRVLGLLGLFAAAMAGLVIADDVLLLFLAWEATTVISFLLIGTRDHLAYARQAARRSLAVTGTGGLSLLVGLLVLVEITGARTLSGIAAVVTAGGVDAGGLTAAAALVLGGVATKSAFAPAHPWLPGAMAAPAPVSAYLHSATMVKAGIFLLAKMTPTFATVQLWDVAVLATAGGGVLIGGWKAIRATDLKQLFAWSTVSQLGLLGIVLSSGAPKVVLSGMAMLLAHAIAKAALFLAVGTVEAGSGTRELPDLQGLGRRAPVVAATISIGLASLAGVFPLSGFVAKEGALLGLIADGDVTRIAIVTVGSAMTATYAFRVILALWRPDAARASGSSAKPPWTAPPRAMTLAPAVLVAGVVLTGLAVGFGQRLVEPAAQAVTASADVGTLKLIPALDLALTLSLLSLAVGFIASRLIPTGSGRPTGQLVDALIDVPARAGGLVQRIMRPGDGPATIGVLAATGATGVGAGLLLGGVPALPPLGRPIVLALSAAMVAGAAVAAGLRHRFAAALALGVVGFAMTGLFVVIGAPDLALTQALVETIIVLAFLLVLRRVPDTRQRRSTSRPAAATRAAIAGGTGLAVAGLAAAVSSADRISGVGQTITDQAFEVGEGRNIVNIILTDVRALDTLGEIAVIGVAAFGVTRLLVDSRARKEPSR